jgi:hypothetical protein
MEVRAHDPDPARIAQTMSNGELNRFFRISSAYNQFFACATTQLTG